MSDAETCDLCGPNAKRAALRTDDLALCPGHWNAWLAAYLPNPLRQIGPPCGAHLISAEVAE